MPALAAGGGNGEVADELLNLAQPAFGLLHVLQCLREDALLEGRERVLDLRVQPVAQELKRACEALFGHSCHRTVTRFTPHAACVPLPARQSIVTPTPGRRNAHAYV